MVEFQEGDFFLVWIQIFVGFGVFFKMEIDFESGGDITYLLIGMLKCVSMEINKVKFCFLFFNLCLE